MTNAVKAGVITFVNAVLVALPLFYVPITEQQSAAVGLVVNTGLGLWVALTYKNSHKRIPGA